MNTNILKKSFNYIEDSYLNIILPGDLILFTTHRLNPPNLGICEYAYKNNELILLLYNPTFPYKTYIYNDFDDFDCIDSIVKKYTKKYIEKYYDLFNKLSQNLNNIPRKQFINFFKIKYKSICYRNNWNELPIFDGINTSLTGYNKNINKCELKLIYPNRNHVEYIWKSYFDNINIM